MTISFGDARIDVDARRIWRGSEPVHLIRKAFDLLILLMENRRNAVTKEAIHQHLWPDTYVSESSLQALVSEIRQALGDSGRRQEIVRTIHGVGYAFEAASADPPPISSRTTLAWLIRDLDRVPLHAGDNVLGRGGDGVIDVDDPTVSRRHARIHIGTRTFIEDLGSKNGSWCGEKRVRRRLAIQDGDVVRLGSVRFTFRLARAAKSTETVHPRVGG